MDEVAAATDQHEVEATEEDDVKVMVEVDETAEKNECDESVKVKECDGEGEIIPSGSAADKKINSLDEAESRWRVGRKQQMVLSPSKMVAIAVKCPVCIFKTVLRILSQVSRRSKKSNV